MPKNKEVTNKTKLNKYSVLLLRPDYIACTFGHDTYYTHVVARNAKMAVRAARRDVCEADGQATGAAIDYYVLLVLAGHRKDIYYSGR